MIDLDKLINPGDRPSRLEIGQAWSSEIDDTQARAIRDGAASQPASVAWLEGLDAARDEVAPFDPELLRKRAFRIREDEQREAELEAKREAQPRAAWWREFLSVTGAVAAATVAIVVLLPPVDRPTTREQHVTPHTTAGAKGSGAIDFYLLRDDQVHPGSEDEIHWAGDRVQFSYRTQGESTLVLLSVDGRGELNLYYPDVGDDPVPVVPGERHMLDGSIILDDAPDFELILAYFGHSSVAEVNDEVRAILDEEGREGLLLLAEDYMDVDSIFLHKGETSPAAGER